MSNPTTLLITPSPTTAAAIEVAAAGLNCRLERAHSIGDALARLQTHVFDLIIVDQDQRTGLGIDLLSQMRELAPESQRALIIGETEGADVVVDALNRAGVSLIFKKPLTDLNFVKKSLRQALSSSRLQRESYATEHSRKLERLYTVGEIASDLIHQFSNILTIMNGHMELLMGELDDQNHKNRAETILQAGQDGARLTRNVQDFVRLSKSQMEAVHLNHLIEETLQMTEPMRKSRTTSNGRGIEIQTHLQDLPPITASASEIREAMTNLVINAVDAMPHGGNLTIRTKLTQEGICLDIEDTGIGMPETVQDRIFDPFFTTKGDKGNGLGLGIVRRIIRACGGTIGVSSQPGKGTCFAIVFPIRQDTTKQSEQALVSAIA